MYLNYLYQIKATFSGWGSVGRTMVLLLKLHNGETRSQQCLTRSQCCFTMMEEVVKLSAFFFILLWCSMEMPALVCSSKENYIISLNRIRRNVEQITILLDLIYVVTVLGVHFSPHFKLNYYSLEKKLYIIPFKCFS